MVRFNCDNPEGNVVSMAIPAARLSERIKEHFVSGKGHALLLLVLIALALCGRLLWLSYAPIPLSRLDFEEIVITDVDGVVVGTIESGMLIKRDDMLLWQQQEECRVLTRNFVNLLRSSELYINTGREVMPLSAEGILGSPVRIDERLQGALLVSVSEQGWLHFFQDQQLWIQYAGRIEAGPVLSGNYLPGFVERDWRDGVLFFTDQGWTIYSDYQKQRQYQLPAMRGTIAQAVLSPCGSAVVFAVEQDGTTELWQSDSDGSSQLQWLSEDMTFAALDVIWSVDGRQVVLAVIGYSGTGGVEDEYTSVTLFARPGQGQVVELHRSQNQAIMAAVPTAWAGDQMAVYVHNVHRENAVPSLYRFFRRH